MKQTQPGEEKGHPQAFCISTTVSDISLAKQSGMDVRLQPFFRLHTFFKGADSNPASFLFLTNLIAVTSLKLAKVRIKEG